ncbi:hypothetical protein ABBQ32_003939 [Trebouxia sp. C0010 RCD-2024]
MVNASSTTAAVYRLQAWPQRANHGKSHQRVPCACKSTPTPRSAGGGAVNIRRLRCSAAIPNSTTGSVLTCSNSRQTSHKGSGPSHACTSRLPINLAALLLKVSCRLIETLATVSLLTHPLPAMAGEIIQGSPRVSDGDTIQINDQKIRLYGFDAPEKAQLCKNAQGADYSCGLQSGEALNSMIGGNPVRCEVRNKDQYGRNVSSCSVLTNRGPVDIGNYMVSNGYAVAYRQYGTDYVAVEDAAHQAHKGMWQGPFEMPADWRKDQKIDRLLAQRGRSLQPQDPLHSIVAALPQVSAAPQTSSSDSPANGCKIKGNINAKGDKIYHMPGSQYYERTQIDLPQGERWFCTERQAKEAGWRSAQ